MLNEIYPYRLDNSYSPDRKPEKNDVIFVFSGEDVILSSGKFPVFGENFSTEEIIHIFSIGDREYFLFMGDISRLGKNFQPRRVRSLRHDKNFSRVDIMALTTAFHLYNWYSSNKFCGACGAGTEIYKKERAVICNNCGKIFYPRINPAIIAGVTDSDRLLITRYANGRGVNCDALVAGFAEIGETLEETVEREVMEETGLRVKNIKYYKSQPWGFSGSILAGFFCELDGSPDTKIDPSELSSAKWVQREDIVGQPDDLSLTNDMMLHFKHKK